MSSPWDKITRGGQIEYRRDWALLDDVAHVTGFPLVIVQGGWHHGTLSGSTHNGAGAFDWTMRGRTEREALRIVEALRERNVAAWLRSPKYGWTASGPHVHGIVKDSPGLSAGARSQVASYNRGHNGLANNGHDPFHRPAQHVFRMGQPHPSHPGVVVVKVSLANLHVGAHNDDVKDLQRALNAHLSGPDLAVDGVYGATTDAAVRRCQAAHVPPPDNPGHSSVGPRQARHLGLVVA